MTGPEDALERLEDLTAYAARLRKQARTVDLDDAFELLDYVNEIANHIDLLACGPRVERDQPKPKTEVHVNIPISM